MTLWSNYICGVLDLMNAAFSFDSQVRQYIAGKWEIIHHDKGVCVCVCVCERERETDRVCVVMYVCLHTGGNTKSA